MTGELLQSSKLTPVYQMGLSEHRVMSDSLLVTNCLWAWVDSVLFDLPVMILNWQRD